MPRLSNSTRTSGTPYYRASGTVIEALQPDGAYRSYAEIIGRGDEGPEVAEAVAQLLDRANLARDCRRWNEEASCFHTAVGADGFTEIEGY